MPNPVFLNLHLILTMIIELQKITFFVLMVIILLFASSCSKSKINEDNLIPFDVLYNQGIVLLESKKYKKAADEFEKIFFQYPGHEETAKAELMQAYSLYLAGENEEAIDVLNIFIKLHPAHKNIDYAYYLKALANYAQVSHVKLDQSKTTAAHLALEEMLSKFPNNKYAIDADLKMDLVNDHLAGKEMLVGRFYLKSKNPIAAIQRFQNVINLYKSTSHAEEALYRMIECSLMLGLDVEAEKYAEVLTYNYADGVWNKHAVSLMKKAK